MSIDINQPVEQGHDVVINHDDGTQSLGTPEERQKLADEGSLSGVHTDNKVTNHNEQLPDEVPSEPEVKAEVKTVKVKK